MRSMLLRLNPGSIAMNARAFTSARAAVGYSLFLDRPLRLRSGGGQIHFGLTPYQPQDALSWQDILSAQTPNAHRSHHPRSTA